MIRDSDVAAIVKDVLAEVLPKAKVSTVAIKMDSDSTDEHPSLEIVVVFSGRQKVTIKGKDFLLLHEAIQKRLLDAGEERYPFVRYTGEKEFNQAAS